MRLASASGHEWTRVALTGGLVTLASVVPGPERADPRPPQFHLDKLAHAVGHGAFAVALADALAADEYAAPLSTAVVASGLSAFALELCQQRIPGRRFEGGDVAASVMGSAGAIAVVRIRRSADHRVREGHREGV